MMTSKRHREGGQDSLWALAVLRGEEQYRCWGVIGTDIAFHPAAARHADGPNRKADASIHDAPLHGAHRFAREGKVAYVPDLEEHAA
jgi:hypothetical protein